VLLGEVKVPNHFEGGEGREREKKLPVRKQPYSSFSERGNVFTGSQFPNEEGEEEEKA